MNRRAQSFTQKGGLWVIGQSILMASVLALGPLFQGNARHSALWIVGGILIVVGAYLGIAGVIALGQNRTPYPQPLETATLIQHGIYAHVRHPLYSSVMTLSFGWSALWHSFPAFLTAIVTALFFWAKAVREERWLTQTFAEYPDYASRVPRFLPRLRPGTKT